MKKVFLSLVALVVLSIAMACSPLAPAIIGEWNLVSATAFGTTNVTTYPKTNDGTYSTSVTLKVDGSKYTETTHYDYTNADTVDTDFRSTGTLTFDGDTITYKNLTDEEPYGSVKCVIDGDTMTLTEPTDNLTTAFSKQVWTKIAATE